MIVVPAWMEPDNGYGPNGVQMRATQSAEGYRLNGIKRHVFYGKAAQKLLVLVRTGDGAQDIDLLLVDTNAPGVVLDQQMSMAYDTQYRVTFKDVVVPVANRVGAEKSGWKTWNEAMYKGAILLAAYAAGGAKRVLEITVEYSK